MNTKQILQMGLGTLSLLFGVLLISNYSLGAAVVDTVITFSIAFLLMMMGGFLWVGTAASIMK
ncbi:MAG: hypothetical protein GOV00_04515 [Candidatus Altiarchaeota archaeon]|nr:hypothetical protein [Candidatus Altiarchaeota archaeon]